MHIAKINMTLYEIIKRIFDIILSIIGIIILIPLTIIIYSINKIYNEEGTIFFKQIRIGKSGKKFNLYKYRTMCMNAEEKLQECLKEESRKQEFEQNRKLENDPRVTKIGENLRKRKIDEFPQFINVLKGDMSIVGPRPVIKEEVELYKKSKNKFLSIKPGITGYWQVNCKDDSNYSKRMKMEIYYIENRSIWLDIKILLKTLRVIF